MYSIRFFYGDVIFSLSRHRASVFFFCFIISSLYILVFTISACVSLRDHRSFFFSFRKTFEMTKCSRYSIPQNRLVDGRLFSKSRWKWRQMKKEGTLGDNNLKNRERARKRNYTKWNHNLFRGRKQLDWCSLLSLLTRNNQESKLSRRVGMKQGWGII